MYLFHYTNNNKFLKIKLILIVLLNLTVKLIINHNT